MTRESDSAQRALSVRPTVRTLVALIRHELRGVVMRALGRDGGVTLLGTPGLTREGRQVRDEAAWVVIGAENWMEAVDTVRSRWDVRTRRRAAAMLSREQFDEFVVFSIRTTNEVLRQSVEGPVIDRPDLKAGLEYEARLNRMSPAAVFAEAVRLAPHLTHVAASASSTGGRSDVHGDVESALRAHARIHGPVPAVLLDATVRHLSQHR